MQNYTTQLEELIIHLLLPAYIARCKETGQVSRVPEHLLHKLEKRKIPALLLKEK